MSEVISRREAATANAARRSLWGGSVALRTALLLLGLGLAGAALPRAAEAHGASDPVATSYLAKTTRVPAGLDAKVVDGDLRLWLRVQPNVTAVVLDYAGGPYVRFTRSGVEVNANSAMYYLNQTPAELAPARVSPSVPPRWQRVSGGHDYGWHDGRLQALASVAISPGTTFVGKWSIPVMIDGRRGSISGSLVHAESPSIVWFWPIVVLLVCVFAAWRLHRPSLDARLAGGLAVAALIATAVGSVGRELHGRPTVTPSQLIMLAILLVFVAWGLRHVLFRPPRFFAYWAIAGVALWTGLVLVPTLSRGYVLLAVPAFVARATTVLALGSGAGLLLLSLRLMGGGDEAEPVSGDPIDEWDRDDDRAENWA